MKTIESPRVVSVSSPSDMSSAQSNESFFQGMLVGFLIIIVMQMLQIFQAYMKNSQKPPLITRKKTFNYKPSYAMQLDQIIDTTRIEQNTHSNDEMPKIDMHINYQTQPLQNLVPNKQNEHSDANNSINLIKGRDADLRSGIDQQTNSSKVEQSNVIQKKKSIEVASIPPPPLIKAPLSNREQVKETLYKNLLDIYKNRHIFPVEIEKKERKLAFRRKVRENGEQQFMLEQEVIGVMPLDFMEILKNATTTQVKWNARCKKCDLVQLDEGYKIEATFIDPPTRLMSGRVFVDCKYAITTDVKDEYIYIGSSDGNEKIIENYKSNCNLEGYSTAYCFISGHIFSPLYNEKKQLIGTKVFFVNETFFGGNVPQWIINKFAPAGIQETYDGIIKAARELTRK